MSRKPWETPMRDYIGIAGVAPGPRYIEEVGPVRLQDLSHSMENWLEIRIPQRPDLTFRVSSGGYIAALDATTGDILGGYTATFPYVLPEHRGRGINAELNAIIDLRGQRRALAGRYTPSGFASRVATHRLHVTRALEGGIDVPPEVMQDYTVEDSQVRLRAPYTAEAHIAWSEAKAAEMRAERFAKETAGYVEVFRRPDEENEVAFRTFDPSWKGYLLAIALHREAGAGFVVHIQGSSCLVQSELHDMVIDCDGIRPSEMMLEDLGRRDLLEQDGSKDPFTGAAQLSHIQTKRFNTEADLLACLEPDRFGPAPTGAPEVSGFMLPVFDEAEIEEALESLPGQRMMQSSMLLREPEMAL
ncbi:hypothetical protein KUV57_13685 [Epibacterium sp. DP7N7-1]|nr:hypothetical protein [Epibacterium sp. DP7N7-1]